MIIDGCKPHRRWVTRGHLSTKTDCFVICTVPSFSAPQPSCTHMRLRLIFFSNRKCSHLWIVSFLGCRCSESWIYGGRGAGGCSCSMSVDQDNWTCLLILWLTFTKERWRVSSLSIFRWQRTLVRLNREWMECSHTKRISKECDQQQRQRRMRASVT